ncbi:hypothetical protein VNO77_03260 [Canavalia gladiata]|uniref:Uncharacterized protein n=1 Tax=Canavalia gladiata TaxID=3824 RepID=A0AAN9MV20_CANGL
MITFHAIAANANVPENESLHVKYYAIKVATGLELFNVENAKQMHACTPNDKRVDSFPSIKVRSINPDPDIGIGQRKPSLLARYMKEVYASILSIWGVKIVVLAIFVGFALASIAMSTRMEPGLEKEIFLPRDSSESLHMNRLCSISQCNSDSLLNEIARAAVIPNTSYIAKPAASWLDDYLVWMSLEACGCCRKFTNGSYCPPDD